MTFGEDTARNYREIRLSELGGIGAGIDLSRHETLLKPNVSPRSLNIEYDRYSVASAGGGIKFNNQAAPRSCAEFRPDRALTPLYFAPGLAVPLRGYGYLPYQADLDIGGDFASEGDFKLLSETFHNRRGRTFQVDVSFQVPPEEKLYPTPVNGSLSSPANGTDWNPPHGFDQALDECFIVAQKAGDRLPPMQWAVGVVNIGAGVGLASAPADRISNYALVFMWLDSPGWGFSSPELMFYNLTTGVLPTAGSPCTQAYRAILLHQYVEPGRSYHLAVQLQLDSGTPGALATNTSWNDDGYFRVYVKDELGTLNTYSAIDSGGGVTFTGMEVIRGPQDSAEYLCKYGVRYSDRGAMFLGQGPRSFPWKIPGFIPFGMDHAPLKHGGFMMTDRSEVTVADLYGGGVHTLTAVHTLGDSYLVMNHQGLTQGNTDGGLSPYGFGNWGGLGDGATAFNQEALRGYRFVTTEDFADGAPGAMRGAILDILSYEEVGASYRVHVRDGAILGTWGAPRPMLLQCFRWNQRAVQVGAFRIRGAPADYEDADPIIKARRRFSIGAYVDPNDPSEPDRERLLAVWDLDDAEGTTFREKILGGERDGHFCPFGMGQTEDKNGRKLTFVSGEGEGLTLDLSQNPVFLREFQRALAGNTLGLVVEITCVFTEAAYGIQELVDLPDSDDGAGGHLQGSRPLYAPDILTWESVDQDAPAQTVPLLSLTHRGMLASTNATPFLKPLGFGVEVAQRTDQEDEQPVQHQDLQPNYVDGAVAARARYDENASWVGRRVTMQVGIQPTGGASGSIGEYDIYLAMTPKSAFRPEDGDAADAEFAYWTDGAGTYTPAGYFDGLHINIGPKQLARPVITIGRYDCGALGYAEIQPRMLVEEVRVFAAPVPGRLPAVSGEAVTTRDGKIQGADALPRRALTLEDTLLPLGPAGSTVDLTDDSTTVLPSGNATFFRGNAWETSRALPGAYLLVPADREERRVEEALGQEQDNFYLIDSVAFAGASLGLLTHYKGGTRQGAVAYQIRLVGYTAFADDIRDLPLTLGAGEPFEAGVSTVADVIVSADLWRNIGPIVGAWRARIYSPLGASNLRDVLPRWVRGLSRPGAREGNPALGMYGFNERALMAVQGAVFDMDDRWRPTGPTDAIQESLAFRARALGQRALYPEAFDLVEFFDSLGPAVTNATDAIPLMYDAWVKLDDLRGTRAYYWIGSVITNPALAAGSAAHRTHLTLRVTDGLPELAVGSSASYGAPSARPEKGLFIAQGVAPITAGRWVHLRWVLTTRAGGTILERPQLYVMGRLVRSQVLATDNNAAVTLASDWLLKSSVIAAGAGGRALLGCARDAVVEPSQRTTFVQGAVSGRILEPELRQGYIHSLGGELAGVFIGGIDAAAVGPFDPLDPDYSATIPLLTVLFDNPPSTHRIYDTGSGQYGLVRSHPAVSLYHELGRSKARASFAEYGQQVYVTTGGRVARIGPADSGPAGVLEPVTQSSFDLVRLPLWKPNTRNKLAASPDNDPVDGAVVGAADQVNHFDAHGNNYLSALSTDFAAGAGEIAFGNDGTDTTYFGFKCYVRLRSVSGRIPLFGYRTGFGKGQLFLDVVDGKLRAGWYDLYQKREVYVETSRAVIEPGYWYYIYLRKRWPQADAIEGNWQNTYWSNAALRRLTLTTPALTFIRGEAVTWTGGAGRVVKVYGAAATTLEILKTSGVEPAALLVTGTTSGASGTVSANRHPMNDMLVFRRFRRFGLSVEPFHPHDAYEGTAPTDRNLVSATTAGHGIPAGTFGQGQVTVPGITYTGGAGGVVNANFGSPFHPSMSTCIWVWGAAAGEPFAGRAYWAVLMVSGTQITVADPVDGSIPDFTGITAVEGALFLGTELVKSEGFDESTMPDDGGYSLEFFGGSRGVEPLSGVARFDGEFDSFGITAIRDVDGQDARVFENVSSAVGGADAATIGTDYFLASIFDPVGEPGELRFDPWVGGAPPTGTWLSVHGQSYASAGADSSTQPNADSEVAIDTTPAGSTNAPAELTWRFLEAKQAFAQSRYVRTRFLDRSQGARSNPGPELLILPELEDEPNPSGQIRYRIKDLPAPRQSGLVDVEVYMSAAGGSSAALFLVATVPSGTREVVVDPVASQLASGVPIDFASFAPPRCFVVQAARSRMFYGALESQPDEVRFSRPGLPVSIDLGDGITPVGRFRFTSGFGDTITMMHELDGALIVAKRRALASVLVNAAGLALVDVLSSGVGCVSHQSAVEVDSALLFVSDRGLQAVERSGVTNLGKAEWIGEPVKPYFRSELDRRHLANLSAALNRARNQYVVAGRLKGYSRSSGRLALEITPQRSLRYSLYRDPNITALCAVSARDGGIELLVGGTEEGYAVWLDRADTPHPLSSLNQAASGYAKAFTLGAGTAYGCQVNDATLKLDLTLDGMRGLRLAYPVLVGDEMVMREVTSLGSMVEGLLFSEKVKAGDETQDNREILVGAGRRSWETPWMHFGEPEKKKALEWIDFIFKEEVAGKLRWSIYLDLDRDNPHELPDQEIDLTRDEHKFPVSLEATWFKVVLEDLPLDVGGAFELTDVVFRVAPLGQE